MKPILLAFITLLMPFVVSAQEDVFGPDPNLERCREATVRVHNRNSVGSGTFFDENETEYFILTNNHVAGNKGNVVKFQMWWKGYLSKEISGTVVFSVRKNNYYRDIAVISVQKSALGDYKPPIIPIAPDDYEPQYQRIFSCGCGAGSWVTNWEGHAIGVENQAGDVINFLPQPAGGRSGSAIFSHDGQYIVALIAWRSEGGQHSLDGSSENPRQYGIAMTFRELILAFKGGNTAVTDNPVTPIALELPDFVPLVNLDVSSEAPIAFQSNVDLDNPEIHGAEKVLDGVQLKFFDRRVPDNAPTNSGVLAKDEDTTYTQPVPLISNQETFPGLPRNPQQGNPQLPNPQTPELRGDEPFLFRNAPRLLPKKEELKPEPLPELTPQEEPDIPDQPRLIPKLKPEPKIEPKNEEFVPEPAPKKDETPAPLPGDDIKESFNLITWVNENPWLALLVVVGFVGWFKSLLNWLFIRIAVMSNKEAIRKLVCPSE